MQFWKDYEYKNLTFFILSLIASYFLFKSETVHTYILHLGKLEYLGAFIAGMLMVSTFTVSIATVVLLIIGEQVPHLYVGLIATLGSVIGDLFIFHYIKNRGIVDEIKHFFEFLGDDRIANLLKTKYFSWTLPIMGALILASPLPDELGISLIGISEMKTNKLILLSFILRSEEHTSELQSQR